MNEGLKRIHMQVMWNRLIAVVEEQAQALLRTAFGAITREAGDLSAGLYETGGGQPAQGGKGSPRPAQPKGPRGEALRAAYPNAPMAPGDGFFTPHPGP